MIETKSDDESVSHDEGLRRQSINEDSSEGDEEENQLSSGHIMSHKLGKGTNRKNARAMMHN